MNITKTLKNIHLRAPSLAATAFICLGLGANTHVDAANTSWTSSVTVPVYDHTQDHADASALPVKMQVISPKDASLYRAVFEAQARGDWMTANTAIDNLNDKRLMGHVLADRYLRRDTSTEELQNWLAAYGSYPEAPAIYRLVQKRPEFKNSAATLPAYADIWGGNGGYDFSSGFKTDVRSSSPSAQNFAQRIDAALRHGEPDAAEAILQSERRERDPSITELGEVAARIAASYFYEGQPSRAARLAHDAAAVQNSLGMWISGLIAWKNNDPSAASVYFARLATQNNLSSWDRTAAAFWAYRSLKRAGDTTQAYYWLRQAAQQPRSFYGLLAAQLMERKNIWSWQMPAASDKDFAQLAHIPEGGRALALIQVGRVDLAQEELRRINPRGQKNLQAAMLNVADVGGLPALSMQLGGLATDTSGKPFDAALYPLPPWQPEQGYTVDKALLFALMRHESRFDPTAVSDRGACGLMQLMPTTAKLAQGEASVTGTTPNKMVNKNNPCAGHLLDPSVNMTIGQNYVHQLSEQPMVGDNLLLILAAYNSGPGKIARWMDDSTRHDPLLFVESLPVRETRDYVQKVMIHYWSYSARLAQPQTSLTQLAKGEWPHYTKPAMPVDTAMKQTVPQPGRKPAIPPKYEVVASNIASR